MDRIEFLIIFANKINNILEKQKQLFCLFIFLLNLFIYLFVLEKQ